MIIAGILALILIAVVVIAAANKSNDPNENLDPPLNAQPSGSSAPTGFVTSDPIVSPTIAPTTPEPIDPQTVALAQLRAIHANDLAGITFSGQWVAQLASKIPGITDPLQTTASGSHTFTTADILAEHQRARSDPDFGAAVLLLQSTDYGRRQLYRGQPLWVTVAALPWFSSARDVTDWCAQEFPEMSPDLLLNSCTARKLNPPS